MLLFSDLLSAETNMNITYHSGTLDLTSEDANSMKSPTRRSRKDRETEEDFSLVSNWKKGEMIGAGPLTLTRFIDFL